MANDDVRICPFCKRIFIEDSDMYEEPDVCPHCGRDVLDYPQPAGKEEEL